MVVTGIIQNYTHLSPEEQYQKLNTGREVDITKTIQSVTKQINK